MTDPFAGRELDHVVITDFTVGRSPKTTMIAGQVFISLITQTGKPNGPSVQVTIGADIDPGIRLEDAERRLLESTLGLIRRIGEMDVEELHASWVQWSKRLTAHRDG